MTLKQTFLAIVFVLFAGIMLIITSPNKAQAEEGFAINTGISFYYVQSEADAHNMSSTLIEYYGAVFNIQPEYRFANWYGLGLDIELGGLKSDSSLFSNNKHFYFSTYLTNKFIIPLTHLEIWGEIGLGYGARVGDYWYVSGSGHGETLNGTESLALGRIRIGTSYKITEEHKIGIHAAFECHIPLELAATAGVHYTFN